MSDLAFWPAKKLAAAIRRRKLGSLELLEHYWQRLEHHNKKVNAVVTTEMAAARKRARAADRALARGEVWGPLHGVPMTVKESFAAGSMPTSWGVPDFKDNRLPWNALAVDRFIAAGAVVFGKTNVPLWLADWQSYNEIYGTTNNPWNLERTPGGSSGGSAAALASGLTGLEIGSDIGGSIRVPAHFCGVYGHKPTYGLCPGRGQALGDWAGSADIAVIGPMARSADDLAIALDIMAGPEEIESAGARLRLQRPAKRNLRDFKVAVMASDPVSEVDAAVGDRLQALLDFLAKNRVKAKAARPELDMRKCLTIFVTMMIAALSARQPAADFKRNLEAAAALDPKDDSLPAHVARGNVLHHKDWLGLNEQRHRMRRQWARFFEDYDVLLCPTAPVVAFPHDHGEMNRRRVAINGRMRSYNELFFWAGLTGLAYLPSTVAPIGLSPDGLPVGVQIVGPQFGDRTTIAFAQALEREYQGFQAPPNFA